jgi:hypothetical protein
VYVDIESFGKHCNRDPGLWLISKSLDIYQEHSSPTLYSQSVTNDVLLLALKSFEQEMD